MQATPASPSPPFVGVATHAGPTRQVRINCEASRLLTHSAIEADKVIRRGLNRVGRGRLDVAQYAIGERLLKRKIAELDATIQQVLLMFVPSAASEADDNPHHGSMLK